MMSRVVLTHSVIVAVLLVGNIVYVRTWQVLNVSCDGDSSNNSVNKSYCSSLEEVSGKVKENASIQINIKVPYLRLNRTLNFTNLVSLIINGEPGLSTVLCKNDSNSGIILRDMMDTVSVCNLNLIPCGTKVNHVSDT